MAVATLLEPLTIQTVVEMAVAVVGAWVEVLAQAQEAARVVEWLVVVGLLAMVVAASGARHAKVVQVVVQLEQQVAGPEGLALVAVVLPA